MCIEVMEKLVNDNNQQRLEILALEVSINRLTKQRDEYEASLMAEVVVNNTLSDERDEIRAMAVDMQEAFHLMEKSVWVRLVEGKTRDQWKNVIVKLCAEIIEQKKEWTK